MGSEDTLSPIRTYEQGLAAGKRELDDAVAAARQWKDAVIDQLVLNFILTAEHETNPRKALHDLLVWEQRVALDPAVSSAAAELVDNARREMALAACKAIPSHDNEHKSPIMRKDLARELIRRAYRELSGEELEESHA